MNGFVTGVKMKALLPDLPYDGVVNTTIGKIHDKNNLHKVFFGQCGLETLKKTAKMYELKFSGKLVHYSTDRPEVPKVVSVVEVLNCKL